MKRIAVLFFVRLSKKSVEGRVPIYVRISCDNQAFDLSIKRNVEVKLWNSKAQKSSGKTEESRSINATLKRIEQDIHDTWEQLQREGMAQNIPALKDRLHGKKPSQRSLLQVFLEHNLQIEQLLHRKYAPGTLQRYEISCRHIQSFLKEKLGLTDIPITEIDHEFISAFDFYLRSVRKCANNSTIKYLKNFKKITRICLANGWLTKDPFLNYRPKLTEVKKEVLSEEELMLINKKHFATERLNQVRDIFLFSCFTGLAYSDTKKLKRSEIATGVDGQKWIFTVRKKTETSSRIPLLAFSKEILDRYEMHPICIKNNLVLPVLSNQKMNSYLKEIADVCGINKILTFHIARHTFATTVTLANGIPIESVSKMLGHKSIRTTQHYAKVLDQKVSQDMRLIQHRFSEFLTART